MENRAARNREALLSALRRFPELELKIRRMIAADQTFRDMCEELAEAEAALSRVEQLPLPVREARKAEWQEITERLTREIDAALRGNQPPNMH